jgi:hypothetical protein
MKNAYKILVGKPEGKRAFGRCGHTWKIILELTLGKYSLKV